MYTAVTNETTENYSAIVSSEVHNNFWDFVLHLVHCILDVFTPFSDSVLKSSHLRKTVNYIHTSHTLFLYAPWHMF